MILSKHSHSIYSVVLDKVILSLIASSNAVNILSSLLYLDAISCWKFVIFILLCSYNHWEYYEKVIVELTKSSHSLIIYIDESLPSFVLTFVTLLLGKSLTPLLPIRLSAWGLVIIKQLLLSVLAHTKISNAYWVP